MEISIQEQILQQLRKANKVLIALPENLTADTLGSGLALKLFLQKMQKDVEVASSGIISEGLKFLPAVDSVKQKPVGGKSLVVIVNTKEKKMDELSYQTGEEKVEIYLKSQGQTFSAEDISFAAEKAPLDVVVVLGAASLESLGALFRDQADVFYETPKINIDHQAGNELFGAINLVDLTATSVAEILSGLLEGFEQGLLDEDIATALLAGIITKTNSFQHAQTTPEAFLKASRLVGFGGRQQEIIKNIYKTKSLPLLKLWGRVLARLKTAEDLSLAYSLLSASDFDRSQSSLTEVVPALKELLDNISGYKLAAILAQELEEGVRVFLAVHASLPVDRLGEIQKLGGQAVAEAGQFKIFQLEFGTLPLDQAERRLLELVQPLKESLAAF